MTIVKISLHKVSAERKLESKGGQVRINNNVSVKDVQDLQFNIPGKAGLKFTFSFNCKYEPGLGTIDVEGQVFYTDSDEKVTEIKESWEKNKRLPMNIMEQIVNASLHKGNIQAIKISEDIGLPSPLPLPKVKTPEKEVPSVVEEKK